MLVFPIHAQTAKDSIKSLIKLESIAKDNPRGKDFLNSLADAQAEVSMYLDGAESKKNKKLANSIEKTCEYYKLAATFWNMKFDKVPYLHESDEFMKRLYVKYPELKNELRGTIQLDRAILWCYSEASNNLANARKLLSK